VPSWRQWRCIGTSARNIWRQCNFVKNVYESIVSESHKTHGRVFTQDEVGIELSLWDRSSLCTDTLTWSKMKGGGYRLVPNRAGHVQERVKPRWCNCSNSWNCLFLVLFCSSNWVSELFSNYLSLNLPPILKFTYYTLYKKKESRQV
jgi:hypothetical protein